MGALVQPKPQSPALEREPDSCDEAQRMEDVGRLVSGVAHDFNNLLTGIMLCSDLILAGLEKTSRLRRYAEEIRNAGSQGAALIQQLMGLARPRAMKVVPLSLNDEVIGICDLLIRLIGENISLITELAPDLHLVKLDPVQLQQILLNLVLNARDAMPDGGQITLRTRNGAAESGSVWVQLEVEDSGCGMDARTRTRVFEPFFTTKSVGKGTGLGLATVRRIIKQEDGTVEVESEPGAGTRVIVRLPQVADVSQESEAILEREPSVHSDEQKYPTGK